MHSESLSKLLASSLGTPHGCRALHVGVVSNLDPRSSTQGKCKLTDVDMFLNVATANNFDGLAGEATRATFSLSHPCLFGCVWVCFVLTGEILRVLNASDHYLVLGVGRSCNEDDLKKAKKTVVSAMGKEFPKPSVVLFNLCNNRGVGGGMAVCMLSIS